MSRRNKQKQAAEPNTAQYTSDAFSNPLFNLGFGSQNPLEATEYPLTRLSDNFALLNSLYRDNWVVQNVIELVVSDMLKERFKCQGLEQEQQREIDAVFRKTKLWQKLKTALSWGRLYGGAVGLILIKGQENQLSEPLDVSTILPGTFNGIYVLDRWNGVTPSSQLITDFADPDFGLPEYYEIASPEGNLVATVHHSRIIRFTGRELPYQEALAEMWWGESEIEALYRDVVAHDNVSANMAALTFKANLSTLEVENLDQLFSVGSTQMQQRFWQTMQAQSVLRSNFGIHAIKAGSKIDNAQYNFAGLDNVYEAMALNLCGASHYPMTKLFGRSPSGLNATGASDLQNYYDYTDSLREAKLRPALEKLLPVICASLWGAVPNDIEVTFPPLWTPTAKEIAEIARDKTAAILDAYQSNLLSVAAAQKELKNLSGELGMYSNITDEDIANNEGKSYSDLSDLEDPLSGIVRADEAEEEDLDLVTADYNPYHGFKGQFSKKPNALEKEEKEKEFKIIERIAKNAEKAHLLANLIEEHNLGAAIREFAANNKNITLKEFEAFIVEKILEEAADD